MLVFPSTLTRALYFIVMPMSNMAGVYLALQLLSLPMSWYWHAMYGVLCGGLCLFRCTGWGMYSRKLFQDESRSEKVAEKCLDN